MLALKSPGKGNDIPALLHSIDAKDSDGDGWPNAEEFKEDTLPGDPASRPNGPPLTFEDIAKIKNSFQFTLLNMLHSRVSYPANENPGQAEAKA